MHIKKYFRIMNENCVHAILMFDFFHKNFKIKIWYLFLPICFSSPQYPFKFKLGAIICIYSIYVNRQKTIVLSSSKWKLTRLCRIIIVYMYYKKESESAFFCSSISISFFLFLFFYSCNWFIHICYCYINYYHDQPM